MYFSLSLYCLPVLFIGLSLEDSLQCYSCGWDAGDTDESCLNDPSSVENGILECDKRYCYSIRVEESGTANSIYRSCSDSPPYINKVVSFDNFRIYYLACTTNLCNSGTGKEIFGSSGSGTLYVPGIGNGANQKTTLSLSLLIFTIFNVLLYYSLC